jgi:type IV pilus assembly protein PilE
MTPTRTPPLRGSRDAGFTLMELLVVIAIVGILAAVAIPAYQRYLLEAHRTDAVSLLLQGASAEQRYYTVNNSYTTNLQALGFPLDAEGGAASANGYYNMTATSSAPESFTLTATPENGQQADTGCGSFVLNNLGQESVTGTDSAQHCWQ